MDKKSKQTINPNDIKLDGSAAKGGPRHASFLCGWYNDTIIDGIIVDLRMSGRPAGSSSSVSASMGSKKDRKQKSSKNTGSQG